MRKFNKFVRFLFFCMLFFCTAIAVIATILGQTVSKHYRVNSGEELTFDTLIPMTASFEESTPSQASALKIGEKYQVDLKMFGVIPFAKAQVEVVDDIYVVPLGTPFGMKIYTDGVLVIDVSAVVTAGGSKSPAAEAGIKVGDYVKSVNGQRVTCNEDLSSLVAQSEGKHIYLTILRDGREFSVNLVPAFSVESGTHRIGLWVRDSSAGIGTMTFYSPATNVVCGLGHGICDSDTETLLNVESGELVKANITSVQKGKNGTPGELKGKFTYTTLANIEKNSEKGVYGTPIVEFDTTDLMEIALKQEIVDGKAQILCTVEGEEPKLYDCIIKKRTSGLHSETQNMTVKVTDKELLSKTGGIVQGMSGSPVIQNGKLVGAITHVLVNDPTRGYAIFAENMLETARSVAENNQVKDAS